MPKLRNLFTDREVLGAREASTGVNMAVDYDRMASILSTLDRAPVSAENAQYWSKQFDVTKKNGDNYLTLTVANRKLRNDRRLTRPVPEQNQAQVSKSCDPTVVMTFGDTHAPYTHQDALDFLSEVVNMYRPTMVVHTGDEVDHHALSFHDADPNLDSAGMELEKSIEWCAELERMFPELYLMESNHGSLAYRKAKAHGIPAAYIKSYREVLFPSGRGGGWSWHHRLRIENEWGRDYQFQHQGQGDLMNLSAHENANIIVGHEHSKFGVGYASSMVDTYWSMYTGWLGDIDSLAFAYGKEIPKKPTLGCGIIHNGIPLLIPMRTDKHGRWKGNL